MPIPIVGYALWFANMIRWVLIALGLYVILCGLVYLKQRSLIYYPVNVATVNAAATLIFENKGTKIHVDSSIHQSDDVVLYFGGNAEDVSYTLAEMVEAFPEHSVYLMRYRGYGGSEGSPTEIDLISDAKALLDQVTDENSRVVVIGRSLGSGVATQLVAARPTVDRLVLVTPFDSIVNVAKRQFWFLPVSVLLKDRFESSRFAAQINVPTTVIAAARDTIIPVAHSRRLYESFPNDVARLIVIDDAGHNTIGMSAQYVPALQGIGR